MGATPWLRFVITASLDSPSRRRARIFRSNASAASFNARPKKLGQLIVRLHRNPVPQFATPDRFRGRSHLIELSVGAARSTCDRATIEM